MKKSVAQAQAGVTADTQPKARPKAKRSRQNSSAKPRKPSSSHKELDVYAKKITVCLALFLLSFFATGLVGLWALVSIEASPNPVALQLSPKEFCPRIAQDTASKIEVLENLQWDSYYLVPAYTLLLVSLGLALFSGRSPAWMYGLGVVLLAFFAAGSDLLENHYLESCISGNYLAAEPAQRWALLKWQFLSFAVVAAAPSFLARGDWTQNIGYVLATTGIPGLLLLVPFDLAYPIVGYGLLPLFGLGLVLMSLSFANDLLDPGAQTTHWR